MASFVEAVKNEAPQDSKVAVVDDRQFGRLALHEPALRKVLDWEMEPFWERSYREGEESCQEDEISQDGDFTSQI